MPWPLKTGEPPLGRKSEAPLNRTVRRAWSSRNGALKRFVSRDENVVGQVDNEHLKDGLPLRSLDVALERKSMRLPAAVRSSVAIGPDPGFLTSPVDLI